MEARNLLKPDETAIVIFTKGKHFHINPDGTGTTGYWKINPKRKVQRVIIYKRESKTSDNEVYIAEHAGVGTPNKEGRYTILLRKLKHVGVTRKNWRDFAEGARSPIRYLK